MEYFCRQLSRWMTVYLCVCHATPYVYLDPVDKDREASDQ